MANAQQLDNKVSEVKYQMRSNVDALLERGEQIEDLEAVSQRIEIDANLFQKTTKRVVRKHQFRRLWLICLLIAGAVLGVVLLLLIFVAVVAP